MTILPVFVGASWCQPCKKTKPLFEDVVSAQGLEAEYEDVEYAGARTVDVRSVPTIRVYAADDPFGDVLAEHVGGATKAQIEALFERGRAML
ncbi:thioredoxin [Streptomyces phage TG1]|uniref:Thioredoxin n=1 Tax=Streptomyces phage TG1 TaxID=2927987 RepID=K4IBQ2_9CAUD|nr:thioredoxin [Streptomyces phage TG1]AFU62234.1 thioredoxin [Streptomyces phage TG1]